MSKPKKIERDLPDVERETSRSIHNDQGSTQQLPTDDRGQRQHPQVDDDERPKIRKSSKEG